MSLLSAPAISERNFQSMPSVDAVGRFHQHLAVSLVGLNTNDTSWRGHGKRSASPSFRRSIVSAYKSLLGSIELGVLQVSPLS